MPRFPAGLLFLTAVVAIGAIGAADLQLTKASFRETGDYEELFVGADRAVLARSVEVRPGDWLAAHQEVPGASPRVFSSYEFQVVASGDRYAVFAGEPPTRPPYHRANIVTEPCCSGQLAVFGRPVQDETTFAAAVADDPQRSHLARADLLDLVWVFEYAPGVVVPADEEGRRAFEATILKDLNAAPPMRLRDPVVFEEPIVRLRPMFVFATEMAALVAVLAAGAWVLQLRRAEAPEPAPGTEGLLRLHAVAGDFLARVRDLVGGIVLVAILVVVQAAFRFERVKRIGPAEDILAAYSPGFVGDPILVLYLALSVAALAAFWRAQRALVRWRRRAATLPLSDL